MCLYTLATYQVPSATRATALRQGTIFKSRPARKRPPARLSTSLCCGTDPRGSRREHSSNTRLRAASGSGATRLQLTPSTQLVGSGRPTRRSSSPSTHQRDDPTVAVDSTPAAARHRPRQGRLRGHEAEEKNQEGPESAKTVRTAPSRIGRHAARLEV